MGFKLNCEILKLEMVLISDFLVTNYGQACCTERKEKNENDTTKSNTQKDKIQIKKEITSKKSDPQKHEKNNGNDDDENDENNKKKDCLKENSHYQEILSENQDNKNELVKKLKN